MSDNIRGLYFGIGKDPEILSVENDLHALQKLVGGYIETVTLSYKMVLVCNEEGIGYGLKENRQVKIRNRIITVYGDFIILGYKSDEFISLDDRDIEELKMYVI